MLILEGGDNAGKTTLCNKLAKLYAFPVVHSPGPHEAEFLASWCFEQFSKDKGLLTIYDRFPLISERVYGPLLRGRNVFQESELGRAAFAVLQAEVCPLIIYCRPPLDKVLDFGDRPQLEGVVERGRQMYEMYDTLFDDLRKEFNVVVYDYTEKDSISHICDKVDNHTRWWYGNRFDRSYTNGVAPLIFKDLEKCSKK